MEPVVQAGELGPRGSLDGVAGEHSEPGACLVFSPCDELYPRSLEHSPALRGWVDEDEDDEVAGALSGTSFASDSSASSSQASSRRPSPDGLGEQGRPGGRDPRGCGQRPSRAPEPVRGLRAPAAPGVAAGGTSSKKGQTRPIPVPKRSPSWRPYKSPPAAHSPQPFGKHTHSPASSYGFLRDGSVERPAQDMQAPVQQELVEFFMMDVGSC